MKTAVELIQALRLKLLWCGVPLLGAANVCCDNLTVVTSARQPEATLAKKHNGIVYHKCREAVATGMIRVAYKPTKSNFADLLNKILELTQLGLGLIAMSVATLSGDTILGMGIVGMSVGKSVDTLSGATVSIAGGTKFVKSGTWILSGK
jgi:hypothetical protein